MSITLGASVCDSCACSIMCLQTDPLWKVPLLHQWRGCAVRGENPWIWLAEEEAKLPWTFVVLLLQDHVFVCLHVGSIFCLVVFTVSLHLTGAYEREWDEGGGMRTKEQSVAMVLWNFSMEVWVVLYWDTGMEGGGGGGGGGVQLIICIFIHSD